MRKNILNGLVAGTLLVGGIIVSAPGAGAEGFGDRRSIKDEPCCPRSIWSGFYIGGHVGYGWANVDWTDVSENSMSFISPGGGGDFASFNTDGSFVGGFVGVNHQIGSWVVGLEASLSRARFHDTISNPFTADADETVTSKIDWLFTATARAGYAWDKSLVYVKGGYASASVRTQWDDPPVSFRSEAIQHGWTVGAGWDYLLAPNIVQGLEYSYINLGSVMHDGLTNTGAGVAIDDVDVNIHTVAARLAFKFN